MTEPDFDLKTNQYLQDCDSKDVIALTSRGLFYIDKLCKLVLSSLDTTFTNILVNSISQKLNRQCNAKLWLTDGESCEILKADGLGWQKGKIKLKVNLILEFIPDKPEVNKSILDDIRQEIKPDATNN